MKIYLSRPHMSGTEQREVARAFESNFIAPLGPHVDEFEKLVSERLGGGLHCVALSSGSAALHLALRVAGVRAGDHVWASSMTFAGGIFPVNYLGAVPTFFDLSPTHWTIDVDLVERHLEQCATKPKVIIPTDLYGQPVDVPRLESIAKKHGVHLIVDSAESFGAGFEGRKAGSGGDASILSFNGNKIITTSGGGMLVTKHKSWAAEARFLATQARDPFPHYEHSTFGYNYRLSNICAAIGVGQLSVLDQRVQARRKIFEKYRQAFPNHEFMPEAESSHSTRWLTVMLLESYEQREYVRSYLLESEIEARPLWKPMHLQPVFQNSTYIGNGFDQRLFQTGLCLPSGSDLTVDEQNIVIRKIRQALAHE